MSSSAIRKNKSTALAVAAAIYFMPAFASAQNASPAPAEVKSIAEEAYVFAYPMLYGYQTLYTQTQDTTFPGYIGGFGQYRHYARAAPTTTRTPTMTGSSTGRLFSCLSKPWRDSSS